jgi:catechol 2,3-dioxygenase-like lactoylglutathione lyase family enzyme
VNGFVEIALFSDDVDAATRFYARALDVHPVSEWPGGAIFAVGGLKLVVHERAAEMTAVLACNPHQASRLRPRELLVARPVTPAHRRA